MDRYRGRSCAALKPLIPAIWNNDNSLTLRIPKAYLTAGNHFKSARILYLNSTSKPAISCSRIQATQEKFANYSKLGGLIVNYLNKCTIISSNSKDSTKARYVNFRQNVDWPGEIHNRRAF